MFTPALVRIVDANSWLQHVFDGVILAAVTWLGASKLRQKSYERLLRERALEIDRLSKRVEELLDILKEKEE